VKAVVVFQGICCSFLKARVVKVDSLIVPVCSLDMIITYSSYPTLLYLRHWCVGDATTDVTMSS
jgi:hypothetical protein